MKSKILSVVCGILFGVMLLTVACALILLGRLDILPGKWLGMLVGASVMLIFLIGFFMLPKLGEYIMNTAARLISSGFALILSAGAAFGIFAVLKGQQTLDAVTTPPVRQEYAEVFVLQEDPAESLQDAKGYTFGCSFAFDKQGTMQAISSIEETLGCSLKIQEYPSEVDMVKGLYSGKTKAVILKGAYLGILESIPDYSDFSEKTRIIYEYEIKQEISENSKVIAEESSKTEPEHSQKPEEESENREEKPVGFETNSFLVYLSGSDTRSALLDYGRSDVNILGVVNPDTKQVLLLNTPRDYYIPNPASPNGALDKLTHCGVYGVDCSIQALENLYNCKIDYYAQINFNGFEQMIDAIGGVTVYSDYVFQDFSIGENYLDGEAALRFARERYAFSSGDNQRGKNQMKIISAVIDKVSSGTTIISRYTEILNSLQGMFVTSMPQEKITELAKMQLSDMARWNVKSYAVSGPGDMQPVYSIPNFQAAVMWPDESMVNRGKELIQKVRIGDILTDNDLK